MHKRTKSLNKSRGDSFFGLGDSEFDTYDYQ
jgi:hypothetical protein